MAIISMRFGFEVPPPRLFCVFSFQQVVVDLYCPGYMGTRAIMRIPILSNQDTMFHVNRVACVSQRFFLGMSSSYHISTTFMDRFPARNRWCNHVSVADPWVVSMQVV